MRGVEEFALRFLGALLAAVILFAIAAFLLGAQYEGWVDGP